jgi:hypothetical protein
MESLSGIDVLRIWAKYLRSKEGLHRGLFLRDLSARVIELSSSQGSGTTGRFHWYTALP